jgi:hypothetical protein
MLLMQFSDGSANSGKLLSSFFSEVFVVCKEEGERVDVLIIHVFFGIKH